MTRGRARLAVGAAALLLTACAGLPSADGARDPGALFEDARAIAVASDGTLWVVDAGRVVVLRDGRVVQVLGEVGTGEGDFLDPVAVDPTNGLAIYVADRGAGVVLRFTAEGRLAQTIAVPDVDPARPLRQPAAAEAPRGRPVAAAADAAGRLFVLDAGRRHVLRFDPSLGAGAVEAVLGASGGGALRDPVALAVADDGTLWVADAGRGALVGFDAFGAFVEAVAVVAVGRLVGVTAAWGGLVVAGAEGVALVHDGEVVPVALPPLAEPIRGVVAASGALGVLTPTRLVAVGDGTLD